MKTTPVIYWATPMAAALFQLLALSALVSAQQTSSDARGERLPVSVSLPLLVGWAESARYLAVGFSGVTLSTQLSPPLSAGLTVRGWYGSFGPESCTPTQKNCTIEHETTSLAFLAHLEFYPLHDRLFFVRAAAGISWLRDQQAVGTVIDESRSWPLTALAGAGWDLRVKDHVFATPLLEVLGTVRGEPVPRSSPGLIVFVGVALTIR